MEEAAFNGGARYRSASAGSVTLSHEDDRIQTFNNTNAGATSTVTLPPPTTYYRSNQVGGPHFVVLCPATSPGTVTVSHSGSSISLVLSPGEGVYCYLKAVTSGGWKVGTKFTIGSVTTVGSGTRDAVESEEVPETFSNLSCFEGDECDYARILGNAPLDGTSGRALAIAPMFQDPGTSATNSFREAIRGADFVNPSHIPVTTPREMFEADPLHPHASVVLSEEFWKALDNNGRPHIVEYDDDAHGTSRSWYHIRQTGTVSLTWGMPAQTVKRHRWIKQIEYGPAEEPDRYLLDIRVTMEHAVDPEPSLVPGTGGMNEDETAAWGAIYQLHIFTNELDLTFDDGETYTPTGGSSAVSFTKNDPCAWGNANGVSGGDDNDKFCHPCMFACAALPTRMHSPVGRNYVPPLERARVTGVRGKNLEYCYEVGNASPWCTVNNSPNALTPANGAMGNIVFGKTSFGRTLTLGGDVKNSKPLEWLCWENGTGVGRTWAKPLYPGWEETEGVLTVGTNSGSIKLCTLRKWCFDPDGDCDPEWPYTGDINCTGHVDEPLEGIGGTHVCFHNGDLSVTQCCTSINFANIVAHEPCTRSETEYGPRSGGSCSSLGNECVNQHTYTTSLHAEVSDYDYQVGGSSSLRTLSFVKYDRDPDEILYNYTYLSTDVADFASTTGTWTLGVSLISVTAVSGSDTIRALLTYDPTSSVYRDGSIETEFQTVITKAQGVFARGSGSAGSFTGYVLLTTPIGGDIVRVDLMEFTAGTGVVLATATTAAAVTAIADVVFTWWGTTFTAEVTFNNETISLEADDCTNLTGGSVGLLTTSTSSGAQFIGFTVTDETFAYVEATADIGIDYVTVLADAGILNGYGKCDRTINPDCGASVLHCDCKTSTEGLDTTTSATHTGPDDILLPSGSTNGDNPTMFGGSNPYAQCDGDWCDGVSRYCGECPPPYIGLAVQFNRCWDEEIGVEPNMCRGIAQWVIDALTCA